MPRSAKTKVFISHSREDLDFVGPLETQLRDAGYSVFIDQNDIAGGEPWRSRLDAIIVNCDAVVFVLSPHSVKSKACADEIERTIQLGKRLVPLILEPVPKESVPAALASPNWMTMKKGFAGGLDASSLARLRYAIDTDIQWVREHSRLTELAEGWRVSDSADRLLRGEEIAAALNWLDRTPAHDLTITGLVQSFIDASVERDRAEELAEKREAFRRNLTLSDALSEKANSHTSKRQLSEANCLLAAALLHNPLIAARAEFLSLADGDDADRARRLARTQLSDLTDLERRIPIEHAARIELPPARGGRVYLDQAGKQVLVSTDDGLKRWDLQATKWADTLIAAERPIAVFLPGREAAHWSSDGALVIRNLDTGEEKMRAPTGVNVKSKYLSDMCFSHDGRYVAADAGSVLILDRGTSTVTEFKGDEDYFNAYSLAPLEWKGATCFAIGLAGKILVYDCASRTSVEAIDAGEHLTIDSVAFDAANERFYSGGTAKVVYDSAAGEEAARLGEHDDTITAVTLLADGRLVSAGWDGAAKLWNLDEAELEVAVPTDATMDEPTISDCSASADGQSFALLEDVGRINIWRCRPGAHDARLRHDNTILSVAANPENPAQIAAAGFVGPVATIWTREGTDWMRLDLPLTAPMRHATYSADGRILAICGDTPEISTFLADGRPHHTFQVHGEFVRGDKWAIDARQDIISCVALSADATIIAWTAPGGALQIGDMESGRVRVLIGPGERDFERVVFAPSGNVLYAATSTGELFHIDLGGDMRLICDGIPQASTFAKGPAIAAAEGKVAVSGEENTIRILDAQTGALEMTLDGHREKFKRGWAESVAGLTFSPDMRFLVSSGSRQSGGDDPRTVRLWDLHTGDQLWRRFITADSLAADFSSDGCRLFVAVGEEVQVVEFGEIAVSLTAAERLARAEATLGATWTTLF
ncbi:WD40 repeat-containing protein [Mycobacterium lentiflavum]|uniref:WD40 repeat-containing protein n=2 Tax=Mycobacterium lentiflavum TaxID=141349 RepID=A0A0E3WDQ2_MYCLN|nr:WD40 repeat-containing protein [Mycobacterium lentiflavum]